ncbi:Gfo/Idh/MocA family protein [Geomobilimonas luticola]|uniref:Gfo/Idh/MocA family oxidoreductase n=1 Tax=Geomobilimonas luticola TaxID=1114878 RepID=A0ABS5SC22_9BACT|nr:Gfo/Idh/MocA family oxidoreductase [Geomobilimonas luticola]MBT0652918.1 Gfo/Idh/MocA family oxidoreductase [Geomobilimonas luticola]
MINLGVIGYGYWGPNVVRNFNGIPNAEVVSICDYQQNALKRAKNIYPKTNIISDCREILFSPRIDAVAIVTPVSTHYDIARQALENGKHIFIEKPFTSSVEQAEKLIELAEKKNLKIMVDHTFLFTGAVKKIKQLIDDGTIGDLYYFDSTRVNLGLFQKDVNVVWDLAPHDLSIMDYLFNKNAVAVAATGMAHFDNDLENVAYITVYLSGNLIAHINVNWLSPVKIRMTMIGGCKKMVVWNDLVSDEKLRVYDRGVEPEDKVSAYPLRVNYRSGDMWAPKVEQSEALKEEAEYFIDCIANDKKPFNDGYSGLRVIKMLEATERSIKKGGELVYL